MASALLRYNLGVIYLNNLKNLEQARFMIDSIAVLKDKTNGNLSEEENKFLTESLYHLQKYYMEENK